MTESKFTSSIARQINMNFWFRQFFNGYVNDTPDSRSIFSVGYQENL